MKTLSNISGKSAAKLVAVLLALTGLLNQVPARADEIQQAWTLAPGSRAYLATDNSQRGLAYNPATKHLILVNRTGGLSVVVLNAANGDEIGFLDTTGITGGTFSLSMVGVADDGVIYAANLSTSTSAPNLKVYRWKDETSVPTVAFEGDPAAGTGGQRWGDSLDVRGKGTSTQILLGSNAGTVATILATTDGENFKAKIISNAAASGALSVAFGAGDTFWTKKNGQSLRHVGFNLITGAGTILQNFSTTTFSGNVVPIAVNASNILAGVALETPDNARIYDISDLPAAPSLIDQKTLPTDNANANAAGSVDFGGDMLFVLDTNNGIVAYKLVASLVAPKFVSQPARATVLEGATVTLSASAVGTKPLAYQWFLGADPVPGATNASLVVSNIAPGLGGSYTLRASNVAGSSSSDTALVTVTPSVRTEVMTRLWSIPTGARSYVTDGNTERGIAYNPVTGHVLVVTRTAGVQIYVLDANTGAELYKLNTDPSVVFGSDPDGFRLNLIRVADDGSVYASNLSLTGNKFAIYRWANDSVGATPVVAFAGDAGLAQRWGDTMDVRGSGENTQILLASRNGTAVAVLTTIDGQYFDANVIDTPAATPGNFGLGVAFGKGDTFWGKANGTNAPLRHVQFDLATGQGTILQTFDSKMFPSAITGIEVDPETSSLYGVGVETPDNLRVYNVANLNAAPILKDTEFFPTDIENLNGTAALDVKGDRVYALDSNNGILALQVNRTLLRAPRLVTESKPVNGTFTIAFQGIPGDIYAVQASTDLKNWTDVFVVGADQSGLITLGDASAGGLRYRFYRATVK